MWWWLACAPEPVPWCREDPAYDEILAQLDVAMAKGGVPGASVAIVEGGALRCSEAVGSREFSTTDPVTRETRFGFGSLTKMLTSAAILRADLDLDAPVTDLVPLDVVPTGDPRRDDPSKITLGQLLSHSAGYRDEVGVGLEHGCPEFADAAAFVAHPRQLVTPPGLAYHYANPGYAVAGRALEVAEDDSFPSLLDDLVAGPFGMERLTADLSALADDGDYARGYFDPETTDVGTPGVNDPLGWNCPGWTAAAGGYGTATDLARFAEGLFDPDGPLDAADLAALYGPRIETGTGDAYGLGMDVVGYGDATLYGHTGRYAGFLTGFVMEPASGTAVVALFDSDELGPAPFAVDAVALLADLPPPSGVTEEPDWSAWADFTGAWTYAGDWRDPDSTTPHDVTVRQDRDHLFFSRDGGPEEELRWVWGDAFYLPSDEDTYVFLREDGEARWMAGRGWSATRP